MEIEITSSNPVVKAIISGSAPAPAQMAAAKGALPLPQNDLLEVLVYLAKSPDAELAASAKQTLSSQSNDDLLLVAESNEISENVLAYMAEEQGFTNDIHEKIILNPRTPDEAIVKLATSSSNGGLIELITLNQQRLIRLPELIEAILKNPACTPMADRRASETKKEFFEKERGAKQIVDELRAQGKLAAAEFIEEIEAEEAIGDEAEPGKLNIEDVILMASFIEVPDADIDDSWLTLDLIEEIYEETEEQRQANVNKILGDMKLDGDDISEEKLSMIQIIMKADMKKRIKLASKGNREARAMLIRDSNRLVSQAVIQNPKLTEQEVEKIAAMRTVSEEVLRLISMNRNFARSYTIIHTLAKNPRCPIATAMSIMPRLQTRDLAAMVKNRNVADSIRKQALRLSSARAGR